MAEGTKTVATNRKARHEYDISDRYEAGLVLQGTEVKSLRTGKANLQEAFCRIENGEAYLMQAHIAPYKFGTDANHDPVRRRKLLLNRAEIAKMHKAVQQKGYTLIPLSIYFKEGRAKLEIGVARGRQMHDKRNAIAERDTKRRMKRIDKNVSRRNED